MLPPQQVLSSTPAGSGATLTWHSSWGVSSRLIPYMEQGSLFNSINYTLKTSDPTNSTVVATTVKVLALPERGQPQPYASGTSVSGVSSYGWCAGDVYVYGGMGNPAPRSAAAPSPST